MFHIAAQLGERFGIICYHESVIPRQITQTRYYGMEPWIAGRRASGFKLKDIGANKDVMIKNFMAAARSLIDQDGADVIIGARHHPMPGPPQARLVEQGAGRAGGGGHRRADPDGRPDGGARPQAQPQALAKIERPAECVSLASFVQYLLISVSPANETNNGRMPCSAISSR